MSAMNYSTFNSYEQAIEKLRILGYTGLFQVLENGILKLDDGTELESQDYEFELSHRFLKTANGKKGVMVYAIRTLSGVKGLFIKQTTKDYHKIIR